MRGKIGLGVLVIILIIVVIGLCWYEFFYMRSPTQSLKRAINANIDILMMHNSMRDITDFRSATIGHFHKLVAVNGLVCGTVKDSGDKVPIYEQIADYWRSIRVTKIEISKIEIIGIGKARTDYDRDKKAIVTLTYTAENNRNKPVSFSTLYTDFASLFASSYQPDVTGAIEMELFHIKRCTSD